MEHQWKPGDLAVVEVDKEAPGGAVYVKAKNGALQWIHRSALRPLPPTLTAEDAAVLEAADKMVTRDGTMVLLAPGPERCPAQKNDLSRAIMDRRTARQSAPPASAPQPAAETWMPKVGDRVRIVGKNRRHYGQVGIIKENDGEDRIPWFVEFSPHEAGWFNSDNMMLEPSSATAPAPTPLTDLERAVVEAARVQLQKAKFTNSTGAAEYDDATDATEDAVHALIAAEQPPDPVAIARKALVSISQINMGPDKASGEWRCQEAAAIAAAALAAMEKNS